MVNAVASVLGPGTSNHAKSSKTASIHPKRAPAGANRRITLRPAEGQVIETSNVPADIHLLKAFKQEIFDARADGMFTGNTCNIVNTSCNGGVVTVNFDAAPPPDMEEVLAAAWEKILGLSAAEPEAARFRFSNGVVYNRVWMPNTDLSMVTVREALKEELVGQQAWKGVTLKGLPRLHRPSPTSMYVQVFVDFFNTWCSTAMQQVLRNQAYVRGQLAKAVQAVNYRPALPRCSICQR